MWETNITHLPHAYENNILELGENRGSIRRVFFTGGWDKALPGFVRLIFSFLWLAIPSSKSRISWRRTSSCLDGWVTEF